MRYYKKGKFNNIKTTIDKIKFDSQLEASFYLYLKEHKYKFDLQVPIILIDKFKHNGTSYRKTKYIADFKIYHKGKEIYVDSKGVETAVFKIKRKLLLSRYPNILFFSVKTLYDLTKILKTF